MPALIEHDDLEALGERLQQMPYRVPARPETVGEQQWWSFPEYLHGEGEPLRGYLARLLHLAVTFTIIPRPKANPCSGDGALRRCTLCRAVLRTHCDRSSTTH